MYDHQQKTRLMFIHRYIYTNIWLNAAVEQYVSLKQQTNTFYTLIQSQRRSYYLFKAYKRAAGRSL